MPTATRTFRVFVSSTFEDLKAERDALQREVFPKLRRLCEENNARFQAIDLRWGVRDEAALDQQTMEICLREIERCQQTGIKPNFIVLLGDRYGWRPLPARIEAEEFERILSVVTQNERRRLVWEENPPAGEKGWYRRNDNSVPAEYILRPRELRVAADAPEEEKLAARSREASEWKDTENSLRTIFCSAIARLGWPANDPCRIKYEASATHQEILKGLGQTEEDREHVFAFFRTPAPDAKEDPDLTALKRDLCNKLPPGNIHSFSTSDSVRLCADVEASLGAVIKAETGRFTSRLALDLEIEAHNVFALDRVRHFTGRQGVLDTIGDHIRSGESRPLVVHGPSGCGKSAVVAKAAEELQKSDVGGQRSEIGGQKSEVIMRFIGVTPNSSSGSTLLSSLCEQLSRAYGVSEETPIGFQPLVAAYHERMARATTERPLVLFLDALDQLRSDDEARSFTCPKIFRQHRPRCAVGVHPAEIRRSSVAVAFCPDRRCPLVGAGSGAADRKPDQPAFRQRLPRPGGPVHQRNAAVFRLCALHGRHGGLGGGPGGAETGEGCREAFPARRAQAGVETGTMPPADRPRDGFSGVQAVSGAHNPLPAEPPALCPQAPAP